jgi:outer membrane protein insertion porin family
MFSRKYFVVVTTAVVLIAVSAWCFEIQAQKATQLVEEVAVIGNRRLPKEEILKHVKTKAGDVFSFEQVQRDLDSLFALGLFDKQQTRVLQEPGLRGGVVITFEVVELPLITDVKFQGLKGIKESELIAALRREHVKVEKNAMYDSVQVRQAVRVIRKFLMARRWANPTVTVLTENLTGQSVSITFVLEREVSFQDVTL